ncbi:hypothetical protein GXN76_00970 [Kroppenstedtia pulmonis]|uniref:Uncharacterized protein n=1 Tax=Kroppenstedtia pulmonis TaxID=1380685 RepID=A0A7D4BNA5_9BACL|nr:hypothetical protein [Kroppenstedtia pulmonis]QKG83171.1 hypothetical protein GXN76_00970 [Kroppenstedtia pulmonis]
MIKLSNLPIHILETVRSYERENEDIAVFPAKFYMDGYHYYYFEFAPSDEQLIVREDGTVPPIKDVEKVFLNANGHNASIHALATIGESWRKTSTIRNYSKLKRLLKKVEELFRKIELSNDVKQALDSFKRVPDIIIKHQEVIERSVTRGRKDTVDMRKREVVTVEDYKRMRGYQVDMVRSVYWQNEIQFKTADDREKAMDYLASIRSFFNWKAWWLYLCLKPYRQNMYTQEKNPKEYQEMLELEKEIFEDTPIEENEEALYHLKYLRNPRGE